MIRIVPLILCAIFLIAPQETIRHPRFPSGPIQLSQGWTLVQSIVHTACSGNSCAFVACTGGGGTECFAPTVAGSVWVVSMEGPTNVTISSVTGGGGTWSLCPASACHIFNGTLNFNNDLAYNLSGTAGTQAITINLSSTSGAWVARFLEALPPPTYTASYDTAGTTFSTTCTTSCAGVNLTLTATDLVYQCCLSNYNPWQAIGGKPWSDPYLTATNGTGVGLNIPSGSTAPTITGVAGTGTGTVFSAIAFKSSAGSFTTTSSTNFSLVQYTLPTNTSAGNAGQVACNPTCVLTVPSTGAGNLLFLVEGDTGSNHRQISSVSGGALWVVPTGANTCAANNTLSCAYVLSSIAGTTSVTVTLTGNTTTATAGFSWWEFNRVSGTWSLDTQGAKINVNTISPVSPTVTCSGTNDVVISAIGATGGVSGMQYAMVGNFPGAMPNLETVSPFDPSNGALFNTTNCGPFIFPFENGASLSANTFTVAFK